MKFILAPDSFKECMNAQTAAEAMKDGILRIIPNADITLLPVGDGGEGTLEILAKATKGTIYEKTVTGPLGQLVTARYSILGDRKTAVVEMAEASGLHLVPSALRNPMVTTSFGTGELIKAALDHTVSHLIVTIGGSATNDCGAGLLQALGARIMTDDGSEIGQGGGALDKAADVDLSELDQRLNGITMSVACDVTNPLIGPNGASRIFGPQKGATPEMIHQLDRNLEHFAKVLCDKTGLNLSNIDGAGAAGGLGAALMVCGGTLQPGIDLVLDTIGFDDTLDGAHFVFTGEGKIDSQTPDGKVIAGIVKRANKASVPVIAFTGSVKPGYESLFEKGLLSVHSIMQYPCSLDDALRSGRDNLIHTIENITRLLTKR